MHRSAALSLTLFFTMISCRTNEQNNLNAKEDYPVCSQNAMASDDPDWGWENDKKESCRFLTPVYSKDPICSENALPSNDPEWGWEEDTKTSCRMKKSDQSSNAVETEVSSSNEGSNVASCSYESAPCSESSGSCSIYPGDGTRASLKEMIWEEMYRINVGSLGKKEATCRADMAVAMAMQEAHSFTKKSDGTLPYDYRKDGRTDGAQNVSIFNMNIDFIKLSCKTDCGKFQNFSNQREKMYLNNIAHINEAVMRLNEGFNFFGIDGALHFHRGGRSGWSNPGSSERGFAKAQKVVAGHLKDNPDERKNDRRISHSIVQI